MAHLHLQPPHRKMSTVATARPAVRVALGEVVRPSSPSLGLSALAQAGATPAAAPPCIRSDVGLVQPLRRSPSHASPLVCAALESAAAAATHVGEEDDLAAYILQGPLLASCGITPDSVRNQLNNWAKLGQQLATQLGFDHGTLNSVQKMRIYHYYLPVFFWCTSQLAAHRASGAQQALVGCGKTTLVEQLQALFAATGTNAASVSIDDFYLKFQDQRALASANPSNPLLQVRGNASTHDLALGTDTLLALKALQQEGQTARVPRYDKSANEGRGDRAPESTWPTVSGPVDVVLFEGWMAGFQAVEDDQQAEATGVGLGAVNAALRGYKAAWDDHVDAWMVIRIGDPAWVYRWRLQAEEAMRAKGKSGMTDAQIQDFVGRYQPAYRLYLPGLYDKGPTTARPGKTLTIQVDQDRSPIAQQPPPVI